MGGATCSSLTGYVSKWGAELQTTCGKTYRRTGVLMAWVQVTLVLSPPGPFTGGDKMPSSPTRPSRCFSSSRLCLRPLWVISASGMHEMGPCSHAQGLCGNQAMSLLALEGNRIFCFIFRKVYTSSNFTSLNVLSHCIQLFSWIRGNSGSKPTKPDRKEQKYLSFFHEW